jgi:hypothetical protein
VSERRPAKKALENTPEHIDDEGIRDKISDYANSNDYETIAEAFTDIRVNGENAQSASKAVIKALKEWGGMI